MNGSAMEILIAVLVSMIGASSFAILFRTPRRYFIPTILLGTMASMGMQSFPESWNVGIATFAVALLVGIASQILARITDKPAQAFLIPGVIFLVPGATIYKSFTSALNHQMSSATLLMLNAAVVTLCISFALLLANWVVPSKKQL